MAMEKSIEQLKHIERLSRQTRHHRTHLNRTNEQQLRRNLDQLAQQREQHLLRSASRHQLELQRKAFLHVTVKQIARERQPLGTAQTEQETIQVLRNDKVVDSRPSSSVRLPSAAGKSCHLFSHDCQLYPCQPIYNYTSFMKQENDRVLRQRQNIHDDATTATPVSHLPELLTALRDGQSQRPSRRHLAVAIQNQDHLVHRHVSMQRAMTVLDEQSRVLHERLGERKPLGYDKQRQHQLTQAIERHLKVSAKFCT